jgi:hypothetical protein
LLAVLRAFSALRACSMASGGTPLTAAVERMACCALNARTARQLASTHLGNGKPPPATAIAPLS